jgi:hypothetical protein
MTAPTGDNTKHPYPRQARLTSSPRYPTTGSPKEFGSLSGRHGASAVLASDKLKHRAKCVFSMRSRMSLFEDWSLDPHMSATPCDWPAVTGTSMRVFCWSGGYLYPTHAWGGPFALPPASFLRGANLNTLPKITVNANPNPKTSSAPPSHEDNGHNLTLHHLQWASRTTASWSSSSLPQASLYWSGYQSQDFSLATAPAIPAPSENLPSSRRRTCGVLGTGTLPSFARRRAGRRGRHTVREERAQPSRGEVRGRNEEARGGRNIRMGMRICRRGRRRRGRDGLGLGACHLYEHHTNIESPFHLPAQVLPFEPPFLLILPLADLSHTMVHQLRSVISPLQ